jgi:hypothetical protein
MKKLKKRKRRLSCNITENSHSIYSQKSSNSVEKSLSKNHRMVTLSPGLMPVNPTTYIPYIFVVSPPHENNNFVPSSALDEEACISDFTDKNHNTSEESTINKIISENSTEDDKINKFSVEAATDKFISEKTADRILIDNNSSIKTTTDKNIFENSADAELIDNDFPMDAQNNDDESIDTPYPWKSFYLFFLLYFIFVM